MIITAMLAFGKRGDKVLHGETVSKIISFYHTECCIKINIRIPEEGNKEILQKIKIMWQAQ